MNLKRLLFIPVVIFIVLISMGTAAAQSVSSVEATLVAEAGELHVGDPIEITLSVAHPDDYQVILPQLEGNWGEFIVQGQSPAETVSNGDGTKTTTQVIDARLFAPGSFETPLLSITITDGSGQLSEIVAQSATVNIMSVLVEGDTELRDIKPQAQLPYVKLLPWIVGGLLLTAIVVVIFLIWRRRRVRLALVALDTRLPHEIALDELARVESLALPQNSRFKEQYTLVSDCLRVYMERMYNFPVLERTTSEIQVNLKNTRVEPNLAREFVSILDESDLVKFSKFKPDAQSAFGILTDAWQLVIKTKPVPADLKTNGSRKSSEIADTGVSERANQSAGQRISGNGNYQHTEVGA